MNRRQRLVLFATIVGSGIVFLDGTVVNLALPNLQHSLHTSFAGLQWVMEGYLLSLSAFLLIGGSLGDIFGRKRIYTTGLLGFATMSFLCAIAPNIHYLIIFRILQGFFAALVVPGALSILNTNFEEKLRVQAIGIWTAGTSAIGAIGPLLGGILIDKTSWRWVFIAEIPLLILCYLLAQSSVKETKDTRKRKLDVYGSCLIMLSFSGIIYGLITGSSRGWVVSAVAPLIIGLSLMGLFLRTERRAKDPMLNLKLFEARNFSVANLATFFLYGGLNGFFFIFIVHLQTVIGFSSFKAGLATIPVAVVITISSGWFGKLATKKGVRPFMTIGPILIGLSLLSMLGLHSGSTYLKDVVPRLLLLGLGLAINTAPLTSTVMGAVDKNNTGVASAVNNAIARSAGLLVIAVLGIFGTNNAYRFGGLLCGSMALLAGFLSFVWLESTHKRSSADGNPPISEPLGY